jgi:hypothetical protein
MGHGDMQGFNSPSAATNVFSNHWLMLDYALQALHALTASQ